VKLRLWPRSLVGQLVFAVAVMLFLAQAINFVLLSRGIRQQTLAHGGGMAVARVIDAIERDRRGEFRGPPRNEEARERAQKLMISETPPQLPAGAVRLPELSNYIAGLLDDTNIHADRIEAWALPPKSRQRLQRAAFPDRAVVVVAKVDGRYFAVRSRIAAGGNRLSGFLVWQTLTLYLLLLIPIMVIAYSAAGAAGGMG